jgi:hypothetical protein
MDLPVVIVHFVAISKVFVKITRTRTAAIKIRPKPIINIILISIIFDSFLPSSLFTFMK